VPNEFLKESGFSGQNFWRRAALVNNEQHFLEEVMISLTEKLHY